MTFIDSTLKTCQHFAGFEKHPDWESKLHIERVIESGSDNSFKCRTGDPRLTIPLHDVTDYWMESLGLCLCPFHKQPVSKPLHSRIFNEKKGLYSHFATVRGSCDEFVLDLLFRFVTDGKRLDFDGILNSRIIE